MTTTPIFSTLYPFPGEPDIVTGKKVCMLGTVVIHLSSIVLTWKRKHPDASPPYKEIHCSCSTSPNHRAVDSTNGIQDVLALDQSRVELGDVTV